MKKIRLTSKEIVFIARLEEEKSPETAKWLFGLLPWQLTMIHVSWSGSACFAQLEELAYSVKPENPIRIPSKGEIIIYPGNIPTLQMGGEFFLSWGPCSIATQLGHLFGNHVLTIVEGLEDLERFGKRVHLEGAQPLLVELVEG